jgi:hypothetical protein
LKKINNIQFIFADDDRVDNSNIKTEAVITKNNNMFYKIKTYRKKSKLLEGSFIGNIDSVGIQRVKVRLPKCDFADITLSNYRESSSEQSSMSDYVEMFANGEKFIVDLESQTDPFMFENSKNIVNAYDKLDLIGITFKILLSEGVS